MQYQTWMHGYNVHVDLYQDCKILGPRVRGSESLAEPIWSKRGNVFNLNYKILILTYIFDKN